MSAASSRWLSPLNLHRSAIGLSAFLLFLVQPMTAKRLLAVFGGSSAVWTTCLLFFQVVLVLGYLYAHRVAALAPQLQRRIHGAVLLLALLALPMMLRGSVWGPPLDGPGDADPVGALLLLLVKTVFLPYLVLSSTSPLVSQWANGRVPASQVYRLYAFSNIASMLALLAYPTLIEPWVGTQVQLAAFALLFLLYLAQVARLLFAPTPLLAIEQQAIPAEGDALAAAAASATRAPNAAVDSSEAAAPAETPTEMPAEMPIGVSRLQWLLIPFTTGVLMVAVTQLMGMRIAPVPLLWVVPLALYLVSFAIAFADDEGKLRRQSLFAAVAIAALCVAVNSLGDSQPIANLLLGCSAYFVVALVLHSDLAARRPPPQKLTRFYLDVSVGGALGTFACALVFPRVATTYLELPFALSLVALQCAVGFRERITNALPRRVLVVFAVGLALLVGPVVSRKLDGHDALMRSRSFYGALSIEQDEGKRRLLHAGILHGTQWLESSRTRDLTTYYSPTSGVALTLAAQAKRGPLHVGLVGLGAGTLMRTARVGDHYDIFEIDRKIVDAYRDWFVPLAPPLGVWETHIGDGRLLLEKEPNESYDALVLDAFAGGAIPVHLLTREAFAIYRSKLRHPGVLCVHTTNQFLELAPVVLGGSSWLGMVVRQLSAARTEKQGGLSSNWVVLVDDPALFATSEFEHATELVGPPIVWTDDQSSLFRVLSTDPACGRKLAKPAPSSAPTATPAP